jgi:RNA polymerase sigma-70 factor (ECF subfamily)
MSGAHDESLPVDPEQQGENKQAETIYKLYYQKILGYISLHVNPANAEDLTQQVFMKAMQNIHAFEEKSSIFTWIFKIAQNTVKNEWRSVSRSKETACDFADYEARFISVDFAKHVEIRLDIGSALKKLKQLDRQIIALRFYVGCTLPEISKVVGMRESAVKNRLYRSLEKLREQLKEWGGITVMSIQDMISIVSKSVPEHQSGNQNKVYHDLYDTLKQNVEGFPPNSTTSPQAN